MSPSGPPGSARKVSVLIAHHAPVMRFGLAKLVETSRAFRVVGATGEVPVARRLFADLLPELAILSLALDQGDGFSLLKDFRKLNPLARALVITGRNDPLSIQRAFKAGACGYVATSDQTAEVLQALEQVWAGELYASRTVARGLLRMLANGSVETPTDTCKQLSDRELEVFRLLGSGLSTSMVAKELHLSAKTIETHRERIKQKLQLANSTELAHRATEWVLHHRTAAFSTTKKPKWSLRPSRKRKLVTALAARC